MKFSLQSDWHCEFIDDNKILNTLRHLTDKTLKSPMVIAGDIHTEIDKIAEILNNVQNIINNEVIYVPGNHDYFKTPVDKFSAELKPKLSKKVHLLDNSYFIINDVMFFGGTMWTDFKLFGEVMQPAAFMIVEDSLNEYKGDKLILNGRVARPKDIADLSDMFYKDLKNLKIPKKVRALIIVTHHAPTLKSISAFYKSNMLSTAFANDVIWPFEKIDKLYAWVHGHVHYTVKYNLNNVLVLTNPLGYNFTNFSWSKGLTVGV